MAVLLRGLAILLATSALFPNLSQAGTIVVFPPQGISDAVNASSPGDTILVSPGEYGVEIGAYIHHPLTIRGIGGASENEIEICYDICMSFLFGVNHGVRNVTIEGLTFTRWSGEPPNQPARGVLLLSGSQASIRNCVFRDLGWGIYAVGAELDCRGSLFVGDANGVGLGILVQEGSAVIESNTFASTISGVAVGEASATISRNIFAFNWERGVSCFGGDVSFVCNDAWTNFGGNYFGCPDPTGTNGNISADPLFCDLLDRDFHLTDESPCLPENSPSGCGLIGAFEECELVTGVPDVAPTVLELSVTPNPVRQEATITFDNSLRDAALEIYDAHGRLVERVQRARSSHSWQPGGSVRPGVYFVRLRAHGSSVTTKFVLLPR